MVKMTGRPQTLGELLSVRLGEELQRVGPGLARYGDSMAQQQAQQSEQDQLLQLAQQYNIDTNQPIQQIVEDIKAAKKQQRGLETFAIKEGFKDQKPSLNPLRMGKDYLMGESAAGQQGGAAGALQKLNQMQQLLGTGGGQTGQTRQIPIQIGNQQIALDPENITPQVRQQLEQSGLLGPEQGGGIQGLLQDPLGALSSLGTGALSQGIGAAGDLASTLGDLMNWATPEQLKLSPEQADERRRAVQEQLQNVQPGSPQAEELENALGAIDEMERTGAGEGPITTIQNYLPTTKNIENFLEEKSKGTVFEPYLTADTPTKKQARKIGEYVGLIGRPVDAMRKGFGSLLKEMGKATATAIGSDAAGWMTERVTGSKTAGDLVTHGSLLAYTMFPGSFKKNASQKYDQFRKEVIDPALKQEKLIPQKMLAKEFEGVQKQINMLPKEGEAYQKIAPYFSRFDDMARRVNDINPETLWTEAKELNRIRAKIPEEGKRAFSGIVDAYKDVLQKFGNTIKSGSGDLLKEADQLFATGASMSRMREQASKELIPRNFGPGTMLYLAGGYPIALSTGIGYTANKYIAEMIKNPSMRKLMGQFFKQAALGNAANLNKLAEKMNKKAVDINPAFAEAIMAQMRQEQPQR